jgi:hypothetical protein
MKNSDIFKRLFKKSKLNHIRKEGTEICSTCGGQGSYFDEGDLHRSPGIVPCYNCVNGRVKVKSKGNPLDW